MKVYVFESEPWAKAAWHQTGTGLDSIWFEGLLTPNNLEGCEEAEIISSDVSVLDPVVLEPFKQLKLIAVRSTGVDHIDLAYDNFPDESWAATNTVSYLPLDEALCQADVISLHVPGTSETCGLLNAERLASMKDGVVIINTARGDVVDSRALLEALASGKVAAAGLDVLPGENYLMEEDNRLLSKDLNRTGLESQLSNHLLLQHPRVLVTPHCAFFTKEAVARLMQVTIDNIEAFVKGEPINIVT